MRFRVEHAGGRVWALGLPARAGFGLWDFRPIGLGLLASCYAVYYLLSSGCLSLALPAIPEIAKYALLQVQVGLCAQVICSFSECALKLECGGVYTVPLTVSR